MPRDFQRRKIYISEKDVFTYDADFKDVFEAQTYLKDVMSILEKDCGIPFQYISVLNPQRKNDVGNAYARLKEREINLPEWALNKPVLLHELAHFIRNAEYHDPEWCGIFVLLIAKFVSPEKAAELTGIFLKNKVKIAEFVPHF